MPVGTRSDSWPPRSILITGAGGTLGRAFCQRLAAPGTFFGLVDVSAERLEESLQVVTERGGDGFTMLADIRREIDWQRIVGNFRAHRDQLDLFIQAAGRLAAGECGSGTFDEAKQVLDVNLIGAMLGCHSVLPWLITQSAPARIVNIASCAAFLPFPWTSPYNASKAGLLAFSQTLACELAGTQVSMTAVCPGFFPSELFGRAVIPDESIRKTAGWIFAHTALTADQVARAAIHGAKRRRRVVVCPLGIRWLERASRWFPNLLFYWLRWDARRRLDSARRAPAPGVKQAPET